MNPRALFVGFPGLFDLVFPSDFQDELDALVDWVATPQTKESVLELDDTLLAEVDYLFGSWGMSLLGPPLSRDYYNSYVIQPMLLDTLREVAKKCSDWDDFVPEMKLRAQNYCIYLETIVSPEGTFPPLGRSIAYRMGAFHLLSQVALDQNLPESLQPAQVRCAITAVTHRLMEAEGTYDENGWLRRGFCGHQPALTQNYTITASLYECLIGLIALGLPLENAFWSDAPADWTSLRLYNGEDIPQPCMNGYFPSFRNVQVTWNPTDARLLNQQPKP